MPDYHVTWDIDITADSPEDAARQALEIQRNPESIATVFKVADEDGELTNVDLAEDSGVEEPYPPGTRLISLRDFTDDGPNSEERITPAGSVWVIVGGPDQDGDYEATCPKTGGWLFFDGSAMESIFTKDKGQD